MYMGNPKLLNLLLVMAKEEGMTERLSREIHDERIGLRNAYREYTEVANSSWRWHWDDYDTRWAKVVFDGEYPDDDIQEFINDEWREWYNPYEDGRDCTGVWFTTWMKAFKVNGKTIVYHRQACDL